MLPDGLGVTIDLTRVPVLPVFRWMARTGNVAESEMLRTFNCGVGMIVVVEAAKADAVAAVLAREGESVVTLGRVTDAKSGAPRVAYTGHLDL